MTKRVTKSVFFVTISTFRVEATKKTKEMMNSDEEDFL